MFSHVLLGARTISGQAAADLRERMEIVHTSEYPSFISSLLRCFVELLRNRLTPQVKMSVGQPEQTLWEAGVLVQKRGRVGGGVSDTEVPRE